MYNVLEHSAMEATDRQTDSGLLPLCAYCSRSLRHSDQSVHNMPEHSAMEAADRQTVAYCHCTLTVLAPLDTVSSQCTICQSTQPWRLQTDSSGLLPLCAYCPRSLRHSEQSVHDVLEHSAMEAADTVVVYCQCMLRPSKIFKASHRLIAP